jgi:hypothetical protein
MQTFNCPKKNCVGKAVYKPADRVVLMGAERTSESHQVALRCSNWHWYVYAVQVEVKPPQSWMRDALRWLGQVVFGFQEAASETAATQPPGETDGNGDEEEGR